MVKTEAPLVAPQGWAQALRAKNRLARDKRTSLFVLGEGQSFYSIDTNDWFEDKTFFDFKRN